MVTLATITGSYLKISKIAGSIFDRDVDELRTSWIEDVVQLVTSDDITSLFNEYRWSKEGFVNQLTGNMHYELAAMLWETMVQLEDR